jgi:hypothetical protein
MVLTHYTVLQPCQYQPSITQKPKEIRKHNFTISYILTRLKSLLQPVEPPCNILTKLKLKQLVTPIIYQWDIVQGFTKPVLLTEVHHVLQIRLLQPHNTLCS